MNFFERRKLKKAVHHLLHSAAHARHMRGDIADPEDLRRLIEAEESLKLAWKQRNSEACDKAAELLNTAIDKISPPRADSSWRENVEIFAVALAVAMAFRTYFLQPFKIPTNSMWPTLYGVTVDNAAKRDIFDTFPLSLGRLCLFGERYIEITAKASGTPRVDPHSTGDNYILWIGGVAHTMPMDLKCWTFDPRDPPPMIAAGSIIASGRQRYGDHIFVDRISYNVHPPRRGNVFVFSTVDLTYPGVHTNDFYIKRLAGLPGESIRVQPPHLVVNGTKITNAPFAKLLKNENEYAGIGYTMPNAWDAALSPQHQPLQLTQTQYLPFGDNTEHSLDGRYFGPVEQGRIVGPAFFVYWPFGKRWGLIR